MGVDWVGEWYPNAELHYVYGIAEEEKDRTEDANMTPVNGDLDDEKGPNNQDDDMAEGILNVNVL